LCIQRWLHQAGVRSDLFAESLHPHLEDKVRSVLHLRREETRRGVLYHHAIGTDIAERLCEWQVPIFMVYHNITPPDFVRTFDPRLAAQLEQGLAQLHTLRQQTVLAVADSPYNERDLRNLGYACTGVLPIVLYSETYDQPINPDLAQRLRERGPNILFVGRLVPNKRQDDCPRTASGSPMPPPPYPTPWAMRASSSPTKILKPLLNSSILWCMSRHCANASSATGVSVWRRCSNQPCTKDL